MEKVEKMVIKYKGKTYELSGGGTSIPAPDSVGSEQIKDHAVKIQDLDPEIEAGDEDIDSIFDENSEEEVSETNVE
jgi:hypothetical protein